MRAINVAWEENLKLNKEDQFASKEAIIEDICPHYSLNINLKQPNYCTDGYDDENCIKCWNRKVEDVSEVQESINKSELTFNKLELSPIHNIKLDDVNEDSLIESLRRNDYIVFAENSFDYDNIPQLIKWLQYVYNYCTELKNKIEYVDFNTAKKHMYNNGVAECEGVLYDSSSIFTLEVIDSDKWILIKVE